MRKKWRALQDLTCRTTAVGLPGSVHLHVGQIVELEDEVAKLILDRTPGNPGIELAEPEGKTPVKPKGKGKE